MNRTELPEIRAVETPSTPSKPKWQATALALAVSAALGLTALDAQALAMGRVSVQSALGEPLRADIDIPEINAEEAASLRVVVASPQAFKAAGMEYSPALANVQITLQRRADGRYFLRLASDRPVSDPFVDIILETNWSSGRIVRDYTMLFDPPSMRQGAAPLTAQVAPVPSQPGRAGSTPSTTAQAVPRTAPSVQAPAAPVARAPRAAPAAPAPSAASVPSAAAAPRTPSGGTPSSDGKRVTVQSGDTATRIANANRPSTISLDQMLVAMLRANPDAFIGGNVNRLRAGAVVDVPSAEQAAAVPPGEASQTLVAQSRDFNEFRRRLAEGLPTAQVAPADRQASGRVQAQVDDKKPGAATPDKLTLSKGAVQGKANEEQIARQRAEQDAATRVAELNRNIAEMNRLGAASPSAGAAAGAPRPAGNTTAAATPGRPATAAGPGVAVPGSAAANAPVAAAPAPAAATPTPAPTAAPTPAPTPAPTSAPTPAPTSAPAAAPAVSAPSNAASAVAPSAAAASAAAPAATAAALAASAPGSVATDSASPAIANPAPAASSSTASKAPAPTPAPVAETTLVDDLLENPIVPATVGGLLLAALLGFGLFKARQRRKSTQVDSSFLESRLQPDSFFGASGGQRVDTAEGGSSMSGSSMVYSPSQLDAAGDVDPVAEADVYLAYGRDLQAEEILKEALRINPQRVAIHAKLLEIYAKRRDAKAFMQVATDARALTGGSGPEWDRISELGRELDSSNPLYGGAGQAPGQGARGGVGGVPVAAGVGAGAAGIAAASLTSAPAPSASPSAVDLDLDLDFSLDDDAPAPALDSANAPAMPDMLGRTLPGGNVLVNSDFGTAPNVEPPAPSFDLPPLPVQQPQSATFDAPDLSFADNSLEFDSEPVGSTSATPPAAAVPAAAPASVAPDPGMIEFDLGALSLDLGTPATPAVAPALPAPSDSAFEPDTLDAPLSTAGVPLSTGFDDSQQDPLATKLALAEEFNAIGDPDGARSLAEEVLAEASGDLKSRAERFLAEIG
jgi:pilus assembly protein FimV